MEKRPLSILVICQKLIDLHNRYLDQEITDAAYVSGVHKLVDVLKKIMEET
jgi:hypothetical protein